MIFIDHRTPKSTLPRHIWVWNLATPHKGVKFFREGFKTFEETHLQVKDYYT